MARQRQDDLKILITVMVLCFSEASGFSCAPNNLTRRAIDGLCNNLNNPTWGQAGVTQIRFKDKFGLPMVDYEDGFNTPRGFPNRLPSARVVSNNILDERLGPRNQFDDRRTPVQVSFGQFLAHDFIETEIPIEIECCSKKERRRKNINVCYPFIVPKNDNRFPPGCKNFIRATRAENTNSIFREQVNLITSFIDASAVYGSSLAQTKNLKELDSPFLKTDGPLDLLPTSDEGVCVKVKKADRCPIAGDIRVSEMPGLSLIHLVWVREHNYIARQLQRLNPQWSDERVFFVTRDIIIALLQHITYNQFLPTVLDDKTLRRYRLLSPPNGFDDVYNDKINPTMRNAFGAAAWRFGHTQLPALVPLLQNDFKTLKIGKLENFLETPGLLQKHSGAQIPDFARGLASTPAMKIDNSIINGVRNALFFRSIQPLGTDLMSLNIQRGRDQGVPAYNRWRHFCGLRTFKTFRDFGKFGLKLSRTYRRVDDVDLFVGGLLERGPSGGVGPTFACIIGRHLQTVKFGDRFWYESSNPGFALTLEQLNSIKKSATFSKIFCRNTDIPSVQKNVFYIPSKTNSIRRCDSLPDIDLSLWKEQTPPQKSNFWDYYSALKSFFQDL